MITSTYPGLPTGRNKEFFHDLIEPVTTVVNDNLNTWLLNSRQKSESSTDDDEDDSSDDSSLTDYQSEEYEERRMQTSNNESGLLEGYEELPSTESGDDESGSSYPNKKPKSLEDTHSEGYEDFEAEDKDGGDHLCKAEKHSTSQHQPDVLSESESSDEEGSIIPLLKEGDRDNEAEDKDGDRRCKADRRIKAAARSSSQHKPDLLSEIESSDGEYSIIPNSEYSIIPEKEDWIDSWFEKTGKEQKGYHYLNVYGFYKKTTKMGGFGVIVRDQFGKPVGASAYVQPKGVSLYYHVLQGVEAGLALALEREIYDLKLMCNSSTLDIYLRQIFQVADHGLHGTVRTPYQCGACKTCLRYAIPLTDDEFEIMFPLLVRIIDKRSEIMCKSRYFFVTGVRSSLNQAAYHLVKQLAKKPLLSAKPKSVTIKPEKFDDLLKVILYEDAFKGVRLYHQQQRVFKKKKSTAAMKRLRR